MIEPFGMAGGALELVSTLIKVHQEHSRHPERSPGLADIMKTIPGAAFQACGRIIALAAELEKDIDRARIDPKLTLDELKSDRGIWLGRRRRVIDNFQLRVHAITAELSVLFDDVVAISNCSESEEVIAKGYRDALESKKTLRSATSENLPVGQIINNIRDQAEELRAQLGPS